MELKTANFEVTEIWTVDCPHCFSTMDAPFNRDNPMQPMSVICDDPSCQQVFVLTYDRDT